MSKFKPGDPFISDSYESTNTVPGAVLSEEYESEDGEIWYMVKTKWAEIILDRESRMHHISKVVFSEAQIALVEGLITNDSFVSGDLPTRSKRVALILRRDHLSESGS